MEVKKPLVKSLPFILVTMLLMSQPLIHQVCVLPSSTADLHARVWGRGRSPPSFRLCTGSPPGPPI